MADEIVRKLTITANGVGIDPLTSSLKGLAGAAVAVAEITDSSAKRALSADAAWKKLNLSLDPVARAQLAIAKATKTANDALAQGIITNEQHAKTVSAITDKYTTQVGAGAALGKATQALQFQMASLAGGLGLTGSVLTAFGPWGFAAAIGLGAVSAALNLASEKSHDLAQKSKEIFEFSEATGLTTTQFQALRSEAGKFGIDAETMAAGLSKFTVGFQELRLGNGKLLEDINKINPALALQMQTTTDSATAFTLFGRAVAQTNDIFQRNALLKAGLGRGAAQYGAFFATSPDVAGLAAAAKEAGRGIDQELIEKLKQLEIDIKRTKSAADTVFAKMFGTSTLEGELQFQKGMLEITKAVAGFKFSEDFNKFIDFVTNPVTLTVLAGLAAVAAIATIPVSAPLAVGLGVTGAALGAGAVVGGIASTGRGVSSSVPGSGRLKSDFDSSFTTNFSPSKDSSSNALTLEATANAAKNLSSVLGSAASPAEKLNAQILQLQVTAKGAGVSSDILARGIAGLKLDSAIAVQNAHNSALGAAATTTDLLAAKTLELAKAQQGGAGLTKDQIDNAKRLTVEQSLGIYGINAQIDAEKIRIATLGMSTEAAYSYVTSQTIINKAVQDGKVLTEAETVAIRAKADALAMAKAKTDRLTDAMDLAKQSTAAFANDMVSGLLSGKSAMDSLGAAAANLGKSLTTAGINNIIKDPTSIVGYVEAGVGIITSWFTGNSEKKKREEAERKAAAEAEAAAVKAGEDRMAAFSARTQMAGLDTSTLAGQLKAFDIDAIKQRADELANGNRAIVGLEKALAAERQAIIDKSNAAIVKSMNDFLESIKTGSKSILSPEDQLKFQQNLFNTQLSGAQGGNANDLANITSTASKLLDIAQSFYASGAGYASIYESVTNSIGGLANQTTAAMAASAALIAQLPSGSSVTSTSQQIADSIANSKMTGFAAGGIVGNGTYNMDSVVARYAGGGSIALAGGEAVTRAASVNPSTMGTLGYINRTGRVPGNDNSQVVAVLAQGFNGQTTAIVDAIDGLGERIKRLEDTTRQTNNRRPVPGERKAA